MADARAAGVSLMLLSTLIAGCGGAGLGSERECEAFVVPPGHAGDRVDYALDGVFRSFSTFFPYVHASEIAWSSPEDTFVAGSLSIRIANATMARLGADGALRDARQVTYYLGPYGRDPVPVLDEWIDLDSSRPVQETNRYVETLGGTSVHQVRFTRTDRPPLLFLPDLWSRTPPTQEIVASHLAEQAAPSKSFVLGTGSTGMSMRPIARDGICEMIVRIEVQPAPVNGRAYLPVERYELDFRPASAWPHQVRATAAGAPPMYLNLTDFRPGGGSPIAAFAGKRDLVTTEPLEDAAKGLIEGASPFATSLVQAVEAARLDPAAGLWFVNNPEAVLVVAQHDLYQPGAASIDRWILSWTTGDSSFGAIVSRTNKSGVALLDFQVTSHAEATTFPAPAGTGLSLDALYRIHVRWTTDDIEFVRCDAVQDTCEIGAQAATNQPYANGPGEGRGLPGILVEWSSGLVLQENSRSDAGLGNPAP